MVDKRGVLVFDYDKALSERINLRNRVISEKLVKLLLRGYKIAVIFRSNALWLRDNNLGPLSLILNRSEFDKEEVDKITKNLLIYTAGGNEKFYVREGKSGMLLLEDLNYRKLMNAKDFFSILEIVRKNLAKKHFNKYYLKQHLSLDLGGIVRLRLKFDEVNEIKGRVLQKIKDIIEKDSSVKIKKILVNINGGFMDFSLKDHSSVFKDILSGNSNEAYYFGQDSVFNVDKSVKSRINPIRIENNSHMLSLLKSLESNDEERNVLNVLSKKHLMSNIILRLEDYWKSVGLPYKWIKQIIGLLSQHYYDEEMAIKKVRKKFTELCDPKSQEYSQKLREFRNVKVKNLAKRLKSYFHGEVIADVGGRADDLVEEILKLNKDIKRTYVTDIGSFSERSRNAKISFVVQPTLTNTPFQKESIDSILISMVLHHIERSDQKEFVKHLCDRLKKGGRLIVIEDTYPEKIPDCNFSSFMREYLKFNDAEKKDILFFYDWFGNRLMRNRDNIALTYNYLTIEEWKRVLENCGLKEVHSEFIKENKLKPDLFPPKGLLVFEKK